MSMNTRSAVAPRNVARAIVIKQDDLFLLCESGGEIPLGNQDGFGLYFHDCRFLNGYELRIAGTCGNVLAYGAERGSSAKFETTNEKLEHGSSAPAQTFGLTLERTIDAAAMRVHDVFTAENYDVKPHRLPLSFRFSSAFEDIFEIRGLHPQKIGREKKPRWKDGVLRFSYEGADGIQRRLEVHPDPKPHKTSRSGADFILDLGAGERKQIKLSLHIIQSQESSGRTAQFHSQPHATHGQDEAAREWLARFAEVHSDSFTVNAVMKRSLLDLGMLKSSLDGCEYISAGLPWYGALFGRDSIIAALQTLAFAPRIAEQIIRLLAKYQGSKQDDYRDEEPGKILHELRRGELAHLNEIPQTPYYGSVDSTPLFLILVGEHANWTGDLTLFDELRGNIERALEWINRHGRQAETPYLWYSTRSRKGLGNQGWKDSGDSIMNADGTLATPPIALVEVQGYVYRAKLLIAGLYEKRGDKQTASRLHGEAAELKRHFNRDFWMDDKQFYALALQKGGQPAAVVSSNPGQALWTGIVDDSRAETVVHHLMAEDMFSGWGIRTLSSKERRYNPIGYHLGTVWPHDNSIIAAGFRRYGFDQQAIKIMDGVVSAAADFNHHRLPEVFAGFVRTDFESPVRYPVACHPQAWAAGSVPFMLTSLLGITADAFNNRLHVVRPVLPTGANELHLRKIKLGSSSFDLRFTRTREGEVSVDVTNRSGHAEVDVQSEAEPKAA